MQNTVETRKTRHLESSHAIYIRKKIFKKKHKLYVRQSIFALIALQVTYFLGFHYNISPRSIIFLVYFKIKFSRQQNIVEMRYTIVANFILVSHWMLLSGSESTLSRF